jgi:hypothetical protein
MRYALIYGGLAGAIAIALMCTTLALHLFGHGSAAMWGGYLIMLAALSLIFVGVKRYRDVECGGVIRFGRAFGLGLGMAVVAALIYALGWELYIAVSGYDFIADYSAATLDGLRAQGVAQAAIDAKAAELRAFAETYRNPLVRMAMISAEILPVGLLVALVSAALLRNPKLLPARG